MEKATKEYKTVQKSVDALYKHILEPFVWKKIKMFPKPDWNNRNKKIKKWLKISRDCIFCNA